MLQSEVLSARCALVTGGAQGIGFAIATRLAEDGAHVMIADLDEAKAQEQAAALTARGLRATGVRIDVTSRAAIQALIDAQPAIDILVNNAGIYVHTPLLDTPEEVWRQSFEVNLFGAIHCSQLFAPAMVRAGWGRIVNIGSLSSVLAFGEDMAYVTSKTAIAGLTRSAAADLARFGITANAICPGNILTDMLRNVGTNVEARDGLKPGEFLATRASTIPAKRLGIPEDIAAITAFLCRDDASYVNGQLLHVNGAQYFGG